MQRCKTGTSLVVSLLLAAAAVAQPTPSVQIDVQSIPAYGDRGGVLKGRVTGANPLTVRVAALIFVSGLGWFSKPTCANTTVAVAGDGTFSVALVSGGVDQTATRIALVAIAATASVPCYLAEPGVPQALLDRAVAVSYVDRPNPNGRGITFAGRRWRVKENPGRVGPGPNYFSDTANGLFVDEDGHLHLKITQRDGRWECAEVFSEEAFGYGRYEFALAPQPDLDSRAVFGAFTWADGENVDAEIDVLELGRFGRTDGRYAQNVVQPFNLPGHQNVFNLATNRATTHRAVWTPQGVTFETIGDDGREINRWAFAGPIPTPAAGGRIGFRFNAWLFDGQPPRGDGALEVVVTSFRFDPALPETPKISAVVDAASFRSVLAPGALFSVFGEFASATESALSAPLPRQLAQSRVLFNGVPVPLLFVSSSQMNGQAPLGLVPGSANVIVEIAGSLSAPQTVRVDRRAPSFFQLPGGNCLAQKPDGSLVGPANPVRTGETIVFYLTGIGRVQPEVPEGELAPNTPLSIPTLQSSAARVGSVVVPISFLGLTPGLVGVAQLNLRIPDGFPTQDAAVALELDSASSQNCRVPIVGTAPTPLSISSINPNIGPSGGGGQFSIQGTGFVPNAIVKFGAVIAMGTVVTDQRITGVVPAGTGVVAVSVTNPDGRSVTMPAAFRYIEPAPSIIDISPPSGPATGGTSVVITGRNINRGATVNIGGSVAANVTFIDSTRITAITPAGSGPASVSVTNPDGQSATLPAAFTYQSTPQIEFTFVPPLNSSSDLQGRVRGVDPERFRVAVLIFVGGGYWTKPYANAPLTTIRSDSTWTCDITTGGIDQQATEIVAYLVPSTFQGPVVLGGGIPSIYEQSAVAKLVVRR